MNILRLAFLSSLATVGCYAGDKIIPSSTVVGRSDGSPLSRTYMTVEFDYILEANTTKIALNLTEEDENIFVVSKTPLQDALDEIEKDIISTLQIRLPNGDIPVGRSLPDVQYESVASRFSNMCFTESDTCKFVKSRIKLSFADNRPKTAMERVTLHLVQEFLQEYSDSKASISTTFVYPMIYSSTVQFEFSPVEDIMSDKDIEDLEGCFYNVYHAVVDALDGDTGVTEGHYVYQAVREVPGEGKKLLVNMEYFGKCRYCTEDELVETVNTEMENHQGTLLSSLRGQPNSTYFEGVEDITFSVPFVPVELPPFGSAILDTEPALAKKKIPWFLYLGGVVALAVIIAGIVVICKDQRELRKEAADTSDESDSDQGTDQGRDIEHRGSVGAVNSLNSNGMHEDYQVYVY